MVKRQSAPRLEFEAASIYEYPEHLRPWLEALPKQPGVYLFHSESDTLPLYTRHTSSCMCVGCVTRLIHEPRPDGPSQATFKSAPGRFVVHPSHIVIYAPGDLLACRVTRPVASPLRAEGSPQNQP